MATTPAASPADKVEARFRQLTGYKSADILASNLKRKIWVTSNGGKYQMDPKGTKVRVLHGPPPPKVSSVVKEE